MRLLIPLLLAGAGLAALVYGLGLDARAADMVLALQRDYQNALARALRALRAGEPGAVAAFLSVCFAYGFLHALGPGHGKAVIGAYGLASEATLRRMVALAAAASMAQAAVAVVLVYAGIWLLGGARDRIEGLAGAIEPVATAAIGLLGLFILWRGARRMLAAQRAGDGGLGTQGLAGHDHGHLHARDHAHTHGPDHTHDHHGPVATQTSGTDHAHHHHIHDADCGCGHAHAPDLGAVAAASGLREMAALVAAVALRPCTGALFLLILTWRFGIDALGILGAFVMGAGVMMVTVAAALAAVGLRRGLLRSIPVLRGAPMVMAGIEVAIGGLIALVAISAAARIL